MKKLYPYLSFARRIVAGGTLVVLTALPASAAFHLAVIDEIMSGLDGTDDVQFVEIRMTAGGQNIVGGSKLSAFDSTGAFLRVVLTVPANVPSGGSNRPWIMASTGFAAEAGITPDFTFTSSGGNGLVPEDGMVCWGKPGDQTNPNLYVDCVAYGAYTGPANNHTSAPNAINPFGRSLVRISETDDSSADFECADPALPQNNSLNQGNIDASTPCTSCGNDLIEDGEQCDGTDDGVCPGACQLDCSCPNTCGDNTQEGLEECDGTDDSLCPGLCQFNCACGPAGALSNDQQKCVNTAAKNSTKIITTVGKAAVKCVKSIAGEKTGDSLATCTDADPKSKISKTQTKLLTGIADRCSFPYAIECEGACSATDEDGISTSADNDTEVGDCISCQSRSAAHSSGSPSDGLHSALLDGATIGLKSSDAALAGCQGSVLKAADKLLATTVKTYAKCIKVQLKGGGTPPVGAACIGDDPSSKIAGASAKVLDVILAKCGGTPAFDGGACSGTVNAALSTCIDTESTCVACQWANVVMGSAVDCDLEDDSTDNDSCP